MYIIEVRNQSQIFDSFTMFIFLYKYILYILYKYML